jgi:hypothetical protein
MGPEDPLEGGLEEVGGGVVLGGGLGLLGQAPLNTALVLALESSWCFLKASSNSALYHRHAVLSGQSPR